MAVNPMTVEEAEKYIESTWPSAKTFEVLITKCDNPHAWYSELVGKSFIVIDSGRSDDFILFEDYQIGYGSAWRHILKSDCGLMSKP